LNRVDSVSVPAPVGLLLSMPVVGGDRLTPVKRLPHGRIRARVSPEARRGRGDEGGRRRESSHGGKGQCTSGESEPQSQNQSRGLPLLVRR
jgi:hypothetical protein